MLSASQLQLPEGSPGRAAVHSHLPPQEDLDGGPFQEEKVSNITTMNVLAKFLSMPVSNLYSQLRILHY